MITLIVSILILIGGFFLYGRITERFFGADNSIATPVKRLGDGVDYIEMPLWKVFVIQLLNIAGVGPIFGAILGAMYGPVAYIWIVFGCIFMGAVHDYFSGMISIRNDGASLPELVGKYLGGGFRYFLRVFTILLLVFVGVAFVTAPADLLGGLTGGRTIWIYLIFGYYIIATLLPINKIIGKVYPFFSIALLVMALLVCGYMIVEGLSGDFHLNEIRINDLKNLHGNPGNNILFPMLFIVVSCGAISGFHSTQSPMMARCLKKESHGRPAFYGAMIAEGIIALIWATAAMNYFGNTDGLNQTMIAEGHDPAWVVNEICNTWFGRTGAVIAIIGVVVLPITTGDTAFRSARLTIADIFRFKQGKIKNRLLISVPLFVIGFILTNLKFAVIWKYLGLSNQILSTVVLWMAAVYLVRKGKSHLMLSLPAAFMTAVCLTYFLVAPVKSGGLFIDETTGYYFGIITAAVIFSGFTIFAVKAKKKVRYSAPG